jgi:winged helix DNA-binding protein
MPWGRILTPLADRVLSLRELNRATLARQLLLERRRLPVPKAIERLAGLQAQWPPSPYIALWSRLEGFERERLTQALLRRQVVKATLMRITLHLVSASDYVFFAGALKAPWVAQLTRRMERMGVDVDVPALAEQALALMADGPRSRSEVLEVFGSTGEQPWFVWTLVQAELGLVRAPESATWRRTLAPVSYVPAQTWLGRSPDTEPRALIHLARRYLSAFGPASRADLAQWSGLPVSALQPALDELEPLRRFRDERGRELLDLPRLSLPSADTPAPVRFLPRWESALVAYDIRERIIPEAYRKTVIQRNGDVLPTFLLDGFVAGTWSEQDGRVVVEPFEPVPRRLRRELDAEARSLEAFLA